MQLYRVLAVDPHDELVQVLPEEIAQPPGPMCIGDNVHPEDPGKVLNGAVAVCLDAVAACHETEDMDRKREHLLHALAWPEPQKVVGIRFCSLASETHRAD